MSLISAFYFLVGAIVSLYLAAFMLTSLAEARVRQGHARAAVISLVLWAGFSLAWFLLYTVSKANVFLMGGASVIVILPILLFFLPLGKKKGVGILGSNGQVDERDTIFSRFDLERDTEHYDDYYKAHPELKALDDGIRRSAVARRLAYWGEVLFYGK